MTAALLRAGIMGALALAAPGGGLHLAWFYAAAFVLGAVEVTYDSVTQALLPRLVEADDLERANSRLYVAEIGLGDVVGPPVGAALTRLSLSAPLGLGAVGYLLTGLVAARLPRLGAAAGTGEATGTWRQQLGTALTFVRRHPPLGPLLLISAGTMVAVWSTEAVLVLFADEVLGLGRAGFGLAAAAGMAGTAAGGLLAPRLLRRRDVTTILPTALGAMASCQLVIGLAGALVPVLRVPLTFTALAGFGLCFGTVAVGLVSLRQHLTPPILLGRVGGLWRLATGAGAPLGALLGGLVSAHAGLSATYLVGAGLLGLLSLVSARALSAREARPTYAHAPATATAS